MHFIHTQTHVHTHTQQLSVAIWTPFGSSLPMTDRCLTRAAWSVCPPDLYINHQHTTHAHILMHMHAHSHIYTQTYTILTTHIHTHTETRPHSLYRHSLSYFPGSISFSIAEVVLTVTGRRFRFSSIIMFL